MEEQENNHEASTNLPIKNKEIVDHGDLSELLKKN